MSRDKPRVLHPMDAFGHVRSLVKRIRINRLEDRLDPAVPFPHKHGFYHLLFITSGVGWHDIDFHRYPIAPGSFFLMKPAQVHSWALNPEAEGFIIEFEDDVFAARDARPMRDFLASSADFYALPQDLGAYRDLCEEMLNEYLAAEPFFELALQVNLTKLLIALHRFQPTPRQKWDEAQNVLHRFKTLVEKCYSEHHDVSYYAGELDMSSKALTMRISRASGQSARSFIQERCLLEAKRLLAYSDLSIAELATACGFDDANYFSRFFKKKTGSSPGDFRSHSRRLC